MSANNKFHLRELSFQIVKAGKTDAVLSKVRSFLPSNLYGELIDEIDKRKINHTSITVPNKERTIKDLDSTLSFEGLDLINELKWGKALLSRSALVINEFLELKQQFGINFMKGNLEECDSILASIQEKFGPSLWLIKNKIALLQLKDGLESQKNYVQQVKNDSRPKGFVAFISYWVSIRNEETVTSARFISQFENTLAKEIRHIEEGYEAYLRYHILDQEDLELDDISHLLRLEAPRSIIDYYEAYVVGCRIICLKGNEEHISQLVYSIKKITSKISDERLLILLQLLNYDISIPDKSHKSLDCYDDYLLGKYEKCYDKAIAYLNTDPTNPILICLAALAKSTFTDSLYINVENSKEILKNPLEILISDLSQIINKGSSATNQNVNEVNKLAINFSCVAAMAAPTLIINNEILSSKPAKTTAFVSLRTGSIDFFLIPEFVDTRVFDRYIELSRKQVNKETGLMYTLALTKHLGTNFKHPICDDAKYLLEGVKNYFIGAYESSLEVGNKLASSNFGYYRRQGYKLVAYSLLKLNKLVELCAFITDNYLRESSSFSIFPLKELIEKLSPDSENWDMMRDKLDLSIILDIYTKHINKDVDTYRTYAFEDFLESLDLKRPSEFGSKLSLLDHGRLLYFLNFICIEPIMDMATEFTSPADVASERLKVCKLLVELDPNRSEDYEQEIKDLIRRDVISKRMKEVDESRIYIDIEKVKDWSIRELSESYKRYMSYLRHGLDINITAQREEAKAKAAEHDIEGLLSMEVPQNEVNALFSHMVNDIRDVYTSHPEFGLDRYLSTRIRHGVIESQLRRPLDAYHLITQREGEKGAYQSNSYWISQLNVESRYIKKLDQALSKFSSSYDALINEIKLSWLQVSRGANDKGLFKFLITDGEMAFLASRITIDTPLKKFIEIIIAYLNDRLQGSLSLIRKDLIDQAKKRAVNIMNSLQRSIYSYSNNTSLDTAINLARTDIQAVFDRIVEWFIPSHSVGSTPYDIKDAISVAEAIVIQVFPTLEVNVSMDSEDTSIKIQGGLPTFVDIMVNILENVVKRSGLEFPRADVTISVSEENTVNIKVCNSLDETVNLKERNDELQTRKELLEKGNYDEYISKEGKSGFFKIHRSLKDFKALGAIEPTMNFSVDQDGFSINISLPFLRMEEED
jgi:hypothetical protein